MLIIDRNKYEVDKHKHHESNQLHSHMQHKSDNLHADSHMQPIQPLVSQFADAKHQSDNLQVGEALNK